MEPVSFGRDFDRRGFHRTALNVTDVPTMATCPLPSDDCASARHSSPIRLGRRVNRTFWSANSSSQPTNGTQRSPGRSVSSGDFSCKSMSRAMVSQQPGDTSPSGSAHLSVSTLVDGRIARVDSDSSDGTLTFRSDIGVLTRITMTLQRKGVSQLVSTGWFRL